MPRAIEKIVENWYKTNINKGGWQTSKGRVIKWEKRTHRYGHPIMRETKSLRDSIKARIAGDKIIVSYGDGTESRGTINDLYGKYHNEGHFPNKKRKFFGDSEALVAYLNDFILDELKKIL
jgi:hypothetical protein